MLNASIVVFKLLAEQVSASNASMKVDESVSDRVLVLIFHDALLSALRGFVIDISTPRIPVNSCSVFRSLYSQGRIQDIFPLLV